MKSPVTVPLFRKSGAWTQRRISSCGQPLGKEGSSRFSPVENNRGKNKNDEDLDIAKELGFADSWHLYINSIVYSSVYGNCWRVVFLGGAGFPFQLKSLLSISGTALKNNSWVDFCSLFDTPVLFKVKTSHLNILRDVFFKIYIVSIFYVSSNPPNIILKKGHAGSILCASDFEPYTQKKHTNNSSSLWGAINFDDVFFFNSLIRSTVPRVLSF